MCKIDLGQLFPTAKGPNTHPKRTYDIKITLNNSGEGRQCIRFGLLNKAAVEADKHGFAEVSNIEYLKTRLYFRFHDSKLNRNVHTLSKSSKDNSGSGSYFCITPSGKAEKLYRMNWIGKAYMLQYDTDNNLYYIENTKED